MLILFSYGVNDSQGIPLNWVLEKARVVTERNGTKALGRNGTAAKANTLKNKHNICFCSGEMEHGRAFVECSERATLAVGC